MTKKIYLDKVYGDMDSDAMRDFYGDWAGSYDDELARNSYETPGRCARALAGHMADTGAPVLDFGCGTGLSGQALHAAALSCIDGVDITPEMLEQARAKGVYRDLRVIAPGEAPAAPGDYAAIAAVGVIGAGAAPAETFDLLMHALGPGGLLVFSFNDHTLEDPAYEGHVSDWVDGGHARLLVREKGPHLTGIDLNSIVYVIEKN